MTSLLITGGTGSFGRAFARSALEAGAQRVVVYSRDEWKQAVMRRDFAQYVDENRMRFYLGDVRDKDRLRRAMEGCESVAHAAALKRIDACEADPIEAVRTNVGGATNVIEAALDTPGVRRVVALSTDKASSPCTAYGATKLCSDRLFLAANNLRGSRRLRFSVVRYGNVLGSRGSVVPLWLEQRRAGQRLTVTDPGMTRFSITMDEAVGLVERAMDDDGAPGCLYVPKAPSYLLSDVAEAIDPGNEYQVIGLRGDEKMHEELIGPDDQAFEHEHHYTVGTCELGGLMIKRGFTYRSDTNPDRLTVPELRLLIRKHVLEVA